MGGATCYHSSLLFPACATSGGGGGGGETAGVGAKSEAAGGVTA
jgi:hypothetical protein